MINRGFILLMAALLSFVSCDRNTEKMQIVIEVSYLDVLNKLANAEKDPALLEALQLTKGQIQTSDTNFINLFGETWGNLSAPVEMWEVFSEKYKAMGENSEVLNWLGEESETLINETSEKLSKRISEFTSEKIKITRPKNSGRIAFEITGLKENSQEYLIPLLQKKGDFGFWETFKLEEILGDLTKVNQTLNSYLPEGDTVPNPILSLFVFDNKYTHGSVVGYIDEGDTALLNKYFRIPQVKALLPYNLKLNWSHLEMGINIYTLHAIKNTKVPISASDIKAKANKTDFSYDVLVEMNPHATKVWKEFTEKNIGREIAMIFDDCVYSSPMVNSPIEGGSCCISGNFTEEDTKSCAAMLKSGSLPLPIKIVSANVLEKPH